MASERLIQRESQSGEPEVEVVIPRYGDIRERLRGLIVSNYWYDDAIHPSRAIFRPSHDKTFGEGSTLPMPLAASWMSCGPSADKSESNIIAFPAKVDRTFLDYMRRIGVLGEYALMDKFEDFPHLASRYQRPIYNVDDLPDEWDHCSVNKASTVRTINTKKHLNAISSYGAPYEVVDLRSAHADDFERIAGADGVVYVKKNNTETTSSGVLICRSPEEFQNIVRRLLEEAHTYELDMEIVVQPRIQGENRSFQYFTSPKEPDRIHVLTVSKQFVEADGKTYAGNENPPMNLEVIDGNVRLLMTDMHRRIHTIDPQTFGFVMCDFFQREDNTCLTFDPGLRVSGNTPTILARMFVEEQTGEHGQYTSEFFGMSEGKFFTDGSKSGTSFADYTRPIDALMGPKAAMKDGSCVLPWGYNQYKGEGLFIAVAKSRADLVEVIQDTRKVIQSSS